MGRRNRSAGEAGQRKSGKKPGARKAFTLRNIAIAGLAVVCGLFFLRSGTQRLPRAEEAPHHAELGSRRLAVRASTIPGAGLGAFARRCLAAGEHTEEYRCKLEPVNNKTSSGWSRTWIVNATHKCNGGPPQFRHHNPTLYINSISTEDTCKLQNVKESIQNDGRTITYVALRAIDVGEELIVSYGHTQLLSSSRLFAL